MGRGDLFFILLFRRGDFFPLPLGERIKLRGVRQNADYLI
jgi:hypothetical protein